MKKTEEVLYRCLELLIKANGEPIVLSGRSFDEIDFTGDIDISISHAGWNSLDSVIGKLLVDQNLVVLQDIWHGFHKRAFILHTKNISNEFWIQLDFMIDFSVRGLPKIISREKFLSKSSRSNVWCSFLEDEFYQEYWYIRRIVKRDFLLKGTPQSFKSDSLQKISVGINSGRIYPAYSVSFRLFLYGFVYEIFRLFHRAIFPTGIFVTCVGKYRGFVDNNYYCLYELRSFSVQSIVSSLITVRKKGCVIVSSDLLSRSWILRLIVVDFRDCDSVKRKLKLIL